MIKFIVLDNYAGHSSISNNALLKHLKNICVKLDLTECRCGNLKDTVDLGLMDKSANSILIMAEFENIVF